MLKKQQQCRHVKFKGTITKWPVQTHRTAQKHAENQDATAIKKLFFCVRIQIKLPTRYLYRYQ